MSLTHRGRAALAHVIFLMSPVRPSPRFTSLLGDHLRAGVVAGAMAALVDLVPSLGQRGMQSGVRGLLAWFVALVHLLAWQVAAGVLLGAAVATVLFAAEPAPTALRRRWGFDSDAAWFRPSPRLAADLATLLLVAVGYVLGLRSAASRILDSFHDPSLARWAIALSGLGIAAGSALGTPSIAWLARLLLRPVEGALRPAILLVVVLEAIATTLAHVFETRPTLLAGFDYRLLWGAVTIPLAYAVGHHFQPSRVAEPWDVRRAAFRPVLVGSLLLFASSALYDATNTHRRLLEDSSILGRYEIRLLHRLTDWDGDGYAARFGGGDCDDTRSDVHPHAVDRAGDGVDSDCFAGDGSPRFEDAERLRPTGPRPFGASPPNILLVTVDTLRPDHVGALGYNRPTTPRIDEIVRTGTVFTDVTAAAPRTVRSVGAMMTGLYPGEIDYRVVHLWPELEVSNTMLSERLGGRYATGAYLGSDYFERARGFEQGFDRVFISRQHKPPAGTLVSQALAGLEALATGPRPFFLWVHFFNPHEPYLEGGVRSRFGSDVRGRYDTEIALADADFGLLVDRLRSLGQWDRTVVVVASDHGEAFGEHGTFGHSSSVYEEQVRSFVAIRVPGGTRRVVRSPVALFDLYATVLDVAGASDAPATASRSLLPAVLGGAAPPADRPIFAEVFPDGTYALEAYAVRRGHHKLIYYPRTNREELYDLASDPRERIDRSDDSRALASELRRLLLSWEVATHRPENDTGNVVSRALVDRLPADVIERPAARFGNEIVLEGYRMPRDVRNGEVLPIDLYFRCIAPIRDDYWFHVGFEAESNVLLPADFEGHHQPVEGRYPTSRWRPGELIHDRVLVRITDNVPRALPLRASLEIWPHPQRPMIYETAGARGTHLDLGGFLVR